jgi:glycosyltransferase involved in cell wall biosynthesis
VVAKALAQQLGGERPVFSVIVPTKGRPRYLEGCLAALTRAEYPGPRFEVVVVNDGGGEAVERVVSASGKAMMLRLAEPLRSGPSAARNAGAAAARGRFLAFTDDDCEPAAGWLAALERVLEQNPGAAAGGPTLNGAIGDRGAVATQIVVDALHAHFNRDVGSPRFFASSNVAFPAAAFRAIGGFDERFRYAEDREICERWLRSGNRFASAPNAVVRHMRTLTLSDFLRQHYGYGRGAWAFHGSPRVDGGRADRSGVFATVARQALRAQLGTGRVATAGYVLLSQAATAAGYVRQAAAGRLERS